MEAQPVRVELRPAGLWVAEDSTAPAQLEYTARMPTTPVFQRSARQRDVLQVAMQLNGRNTLLQTARLFDDSDLPLCDLTDVCYRTACGKAYARKQNLGGRQGSFAFMKPRV